MGNSSEFIAAEYALCSVEVSGCPGLQRSGSLPGTTGRRCMNWPY
ncbi:hypothetical protein JOD64_005637 [Micromonospora luteifusca]|uniref:SapB/AmfS family lantipeptide n=1 Tax=Micromonospora luteifusca TaxID=709860 RepID=A0ABS2M1S5_9ACTN|nr:hypothetical protein [Micromonospora luteifusca]